MQLNQTKSNQKKKQENNVAEISFASQVALQKATDFAKAVVARYYKLYGPSVLCYSTLFSGFFVSKRLKRREQERTREKGREREEKERREREEKKKWDKRLCRNRVLGGRVVRLLCQWCRGISRLAQHALQILDHGPQPSVEHILFQLFTSHKPCCLVGVVCFVLCFFVFFVTCFVDDFDLCK